MLASPTFQPLAKWLLDRAKASLTEPLETFLDTLIGVPQNYTANDDTDDDNDDSDAARKPIEPHRNTFTSPFYQYHFNSNILGSSPDAYLTALEALQTLRSKLREGAPDSTLLASDFLTLIDTYRQLNIPVVSIRRASETAQNAINLMSAHKSKGLEFDTVYVINSIDSMWGERVRSRSRLIGYPENLAISPNADSYDERIRLYFVGHDPRQTSALPELCPQRRHRQRHTQSLVFWLAPICKKLTASQAAPPRSPSKAKSSGTTA